MGPRYNPKVDSRQTEEALRAFFANENAGLVAVYLFGSVARGTAARASDVDVGVLLDRAPARTFESLPLDLEGRLERAVGRPVQVVVVDPAPADLVHRVLRDGILVLETDRAARVRFEVRSRNEYFDLLPLLQRYRRIGSVPA